jgi:hypothetical protein
VGAGPVPVRVDVAVTLREAQALFARLVGTLLVHAAEQGYEVTLGEAYRPPELVALYARDGRGSAASVHPDRLAIDLNLFRDGVFQPTTEAHRPLGEWWESQHPLCRWGGRFQKPDGNHYSLGYYPGRA